MAKLTKILIAAGAASTLGACGGIDIGNRERPDEFAVQRQAPLVVPPDFHLVPPTEGAPRDVEGTASEQALEALFGGPSQRSAIENRAIELAGEADRGIRSNVGDPDTYTVNKGTEVRTILAAPQGDGQAASAVIPS
ncbi:DUF3035 domain-containing protein [Aurantiacibacter aquimixticola]|uniref:DUF3035 domain-containing protein n=1 Tax=Aurantiacibacter aquimixticola TaxID=1958945 RepID=A0A419RX03_9SPHN|nr:DUF3035 domain-containing protein [Aurantiacibacter aquimixticola]RJY10330.1 DUF3035 domain-containing protein [Aurantiacibacter aquimixticola]